MGLAFKGFGVSKQALIEESLVGWIILERCKNTRQRNGFDDVIESKPSPTSMARDEHSFMRPTLRTSKHSNEEINEVNGKDPPYDKPEKVRVLLKCFLYRRRERSP
jgi:hypothetical protein